MATNLALGMRANSTIMNLQKILGTLSAGVRRAEGSGIGLLTLSRSHCRQWPTEEKFVSADPSCRGIIPKYHVLIMLRPQLFVYVYQAAVWQSPALSMFETESLTLQSCQTLQIFRTVSCPTPGEACLVDGC